MTGLDRPGIVRAVAAVLARRGINVASLESRLGNAPDSGTPLFTLEAELRVPSEASLSELRQAVNELANEENLDVVLESGR